MKKLFIPYQLAVLAKEKGYPQSIGETLGAYELKDNVEWLYTGGAYPVGLLAAPLYQQILDWMVVQHKIFIMIYPRDGWNYTVQKIDESISCIGQDSKHGFAESRIESLNQAIKEAFKLI